MFIYYISIADLHTSMSARQGFSDIDPIILQAFVLVFHCNLLINIIRVSDKGVRIINSDHACADAAIIASRDLSVLMVDGISIFTIQYLGTISNCRLPFSTLPNTCSNILNLPCHFLFPPCRFLSGIHRHR
jgi:hypothetical protein